MVRVGDEHHRLRSRFDTGSRPQRQLAALKAAGATSIYREKMSGVRADRPHLQELMASLRKGDVVLVTKLDRLGRSTRELLDLIHAHRPGRRGFPVARRSSL